MLPSVLALYRARVAGRKALDVQSLDSMARQATWSRPDKRRTASDANAAVRCFTRPHLLKFVLNFLLHLAGGCIAAHAALTRRPAENRGSANAPDARQRAVPTYRAARHIPHTGPPLPLVERS